VNVQLIDAASGQAIWADSYDRELSTSDIFDVQDDIVKSVVGRIGSQSGVIANREFDYTSGRDAVSLNAYDCYVLFGKNWRDPSAERGLAVRTCAEAAVAENPEYATGWALLAGTYCNEFALGWNVRTTPEAGLADGIAAAEKAVRVDPNSSLARLMLARAYFYNKQLDRFYEEMDRAIALNPNDLDVIGDLGANATWSGNYAKGKPLVERAMRGLPGYPPWFHHAFVVMYYDQGNLQAALAEARKVTNQELFTTHLWLGAVLGELGKVDEAQPSVQAMQRLWPGFTAEDARMLDHWNVPTNVIDSVVTSLRRIGVPGREDSM